MHGPPSEPARHPARCVNAPLSALLSILSVISVNHPLDYEQVANGVIYLTVMAKDAGNPPLNSTVPITIEVFVSTAANGPVEVFLQLLHCSAGNPSITQPDYPALWLCTCGLQLHRSHMYICVLCVPGTYVSYVLVKEMLSLTFGEV